MSDFEFQKIIDSSNPQPTTEVNSESIKENTIIINENTNQVETLITSTNTKLDTLNNNTVETNNDLNSIISMSGIKKITDPIVISATPTFYPYTNDHPVYIASTPVHVQFTDQNGNFYGIKQVDNKIRVSAMPYLYDIAEGNVPGHTKITKVGINLDVDNSIETLWGAGGLYSFPATPTRMEILSSSASDTSNGVGARTIHIHYLDSNYSEQMESITLNGVTPVLTAATNILRINSFHVNTAGDTGTTVGNITLRASGGGTTYAYILAGYNNSQQSIHTVPAGKTLYLTGWQASSGNSVSGTFVVFRLMSNVDNNEGVNTGLIFHVKDIISLQDNSQSITFQIPFKIPATCDVMITAIGDANNANAICSGRFHGWQE